MSILLSLFFVRLEAGPKALSQMDQAFAQNPAVWRPPLLVRRPEHPCNPCYPWLPVFDSESVRELIRTAVVKKFPHLFLVLLIEGGALMAVELMGAKLVAPFYGNSLYVWTAVLTITVLGLTLGYYTGGRLAKKGASETTLFVVLGISAVLVLALPMTASIAIGLTKGMDLIAGICVTCILLLLPPMLCFGIVGPMVVSLMSSQLETVGKTAGTVYFTSTFGRNSGDVFPGTLFHPCRRAQMVRDCHRPGVGCVACRLHRKEGVWEGLL